MVMSRMQTDNDSPLRDTSSSYRPAVPPGNGIVITVDRTSNPIRIAVNQVVNTEGFNEKTFRKTRNTLKDCVEKVQEVLRA